MFCEREVSLKGLLLLFLHKDWDKILSLSLSLSLCVRLCCWLLSKRRKRSIVAMAWSIKVRVSRIPKLGSFLVILLALIMATETMEMVGAITNAGDIQALKQILMAVNVASIKPSSCLGSWNFSMDPCDTRSTSHFTCGIDCSPGNIEEGERRITGLQLERGAAYEGTLSPHIGDLTALQRVIISGNSFHGLVPASLAQLKELVHLDLSSNLFSGSLPESLGLLQNLNFFSVAYNSLVGQIPKSFNNMMSIVYMYLNNNQLSGNLPELSELKRLQYLDVSNNRLSGSLPAQFPPMLELLSLGKNQLSGDLPVGMKSLSFLQVLDLRSNSLTGSLEALIYELSSLQQLNLAHNQFTSLGRTTVSGTSSSSKLISLNVSFNSLQGAIPESVTRLPKLTVLALQSNLLTGPIPHNLALKAANLLSGTEQLRQLYLENNYLTGDIPWPFFSLSADTNIAYLGMNCFKSCPPSFFFCQRDTQRSETECHNGLKTSLLI
ncbi:unnamed protein product [Sphagnum jensenii]|uniref:Leucine-rich repeat receptor-like protein kinase n=1 Tax=Sphagnum jensenii TaxID=128206 RepID=A0ABP0VRP0_9BRYO